MIKVDCEEENTKKYELKIGDKTIATLISKEDINPGDALIMMANSIIKFIKGDCNENVD